MEKIKSPLLFFVNLIALIVFCVGLIAPLTPSEGMPSYHVIFVFAGLPILVFGIVFFLTSKPLLRVFVLVEIGAVLALSVYVFAHAF